MRAVTRRAFLTGVGATGLLASGIAGVPACDDAVPAKRAAIPTVRTDVHLDLGHLAAWPRDEVARLELHVGGSSYRVAAHTEATLAAFPGDDAARARLTHFVNDVPFSAIGAQSYTVGWRDDAGVVAPVLAGIHVPVTGGLSDAGIPNDDPIHITDFETAALYCVFHNPQVLALDPKVAATVIAHIRRAASFPLLVSEIHKAGPARSPDRAGDGGVSGWLVGRYLLDGKGQKIPDDINGKAGKGFRFQWVPAPGVEHATTAVVAETLERFHDDPGLLGVKFHTVAGVGARPPRSELAGHAALTEEEFAFVFPDQGKRRGFRSFEVERQAANKFRLEVKNPCALGALVGMRTIGPTGEVLTKDRLIGYVPGTYYPSATAVFGPSSAVFEGIEIPQGAAKIDLYSATIAANAGDICLSNNVEPATENEGEAELFGVIVLSGILDFFMPLTMLTLGLGGEIARSLSLEVLKEIIKDIGYELLAELAKDVFADVFNVAAGHFGVSALLDALAEIGKGIFAAIVKLVAKPAFAAVGVVIATTIGEIALVEGATQAALPVIGWVLKGIDVAQELAQLAIQGVHIAQGLALVRARLEPAHPVSVVLAPDAAESAYLPQSATSYEITVTPQGRLPIQYEGACNPGQKATITTECPEPVALFGTLKIEATLRNGAREIVARGERTVPNGTEVGKAQDVDLEMKAVAVPITGRSRLVHTRRLVITPAGRAFDGREPPTADDAALDCSDAKKLCRVRGITLSQRAGVLGYAFDTPMPCAGGGVASQLHVLPVVGAPEVRALACGTSAPIQVALARGEGPSCVVVQGADRRYRIFPYDPARALPQGFDPKDAVGHLKGRSLVRARMHEAGYVVALTDVGAEVVAIEEAKLLGRPADPELFVRRGHQRGQMSGAIAIAPLRGLRGYALLEQGTRRVQALDFGGNYLDVWVRGSEIPLRADAGRVFADVEIDAAGNVWVLSYVPNGGSPAAFTVDVYGPKGDFVVSFDKVNALGLAVDLFGGLFTVNAENAVGPNGYPEPSISVWTPENTP